MNILYVVPYVPNLIRVRPYNLIKHLSARGHRLTVLTLWVDGREREGIEDLKNFCYQVKSVRVTRSRSLLNSLMALPTRTPLQAVYSWQPALARQVVHLAYQSSGKEAIDVVHVEHLRGAHYGLYLKSGLQRGLPVSKPVVWDSVDSISLLFRQATTRSKTRFGRLLTRFELGRTERYEGWLLGQFDHTLVTSPADKEALLSLPVSNGLQPSEISVIPNGVDLAYFSEGEDISREPATLVVSGKMSYHANVTMTLHLVRDIMPLIWAKKPEVKLLVVGKDPAREISSLAENPAVIVTGTVDDIRPYLKRGTVAVAPIMYGAGIQNKVLEAMACATPVVSTPQAVSAIGAVAGQDVLVAQGAEAFAREVLCLLEDPQRRRQVGEAGRRYVESNHHWGRIAERLEGIYEEAVRTANF